MKKVISVMMVAVALMMAAPAQAQLIKFGVKGGVNMSELDFKGGYEGNKDIEVELFFEKMPKQVSAKLKVGTIQNAVVGKTSTVDVYAKISDGRIYEYKNLAIDSNGYVTLSIREGEFDIWADSELVTSKYNHVVITENTTSLGAVTLDVLKVGSTTVNGKTVTYSVGPGEENLHTDGAYNAPSRSQQHIWVPATKISGDFVFTSTITLSGDPNSPYYA